MELTELTDTLLALLWLAGALAQIAGQLPVVRHR
jgi:hypothetical protein